MLAMGTLIVCRNVPCLGSELNLAFKDILTEFLIFNFKF